MFEREARLYGMMLGYCKMQTADLKEEDMNRRAHRDGGNPPAWILGHLAVCTDFAAKRLGLEPACPKEWGAQFGPGSQRISEETKCPSKQELLDALVRGHERVTKAALVATPEALQQPHEIAFLKDVLPTQGDLLAHLMTTHEGIHMGQLSTWRRQMGYPSVLPI